jgi:hypothetical protein
MVQSRRNCESLADVKRHYRVTYDSDHGSSFCVHKPNGEIREFTESPRGLYYMVETNSIAVMDANKGAATFCRHAHATDEMTKCENREDYQWSENAETAASEIVFHMNTSQQEVLSTYSNGYRDDFGWWQLIGGVK